VQKHKLSEILKFIRNGASIKQTKNAGGFPITRIETISDLTINRERLGYAGITDISKYSEYVLRNDDILMSHINSVKHLGKSAIYKKKGDEQIIHGMNLLCLRTVEFVCADYLNYYFHSPYFYKSIQSFIKPAVNQASITTTDLKKVEISVPSLAKQQHIASELDIVCGILAKQKRQYKLFDDLIKSKFNEMFGDPVTNPMRWKVVEIGEVAKLEGGYAFSSKDYKKSGIRIIKITNVTKDVLDWDEVEYVSEALAEKCKRFLIKKGDLLMAMTRPIIKSLEAVKIAKATNEDLPALVNQRVGRFAIDKDKLSSAYLLEFCKHPLFKSQIEKFGSNSLQPNVSSKQVESILIMLPPFDLQQQFAEFVTQVEQSKAKLKAEITQTETLYKALMQKYFGDKEVAA